VEPRPAVGGLTRWLIPIGALIGVAVWLFQTDGRPDREPERIFSDSPNVSDQIVAEVPIATDNDGSGDAEAELPPASEPAPRITSFMNLRGLSPAPAVRAAFDKLVAEARDPLWASGMEARFQSELSRSTLLLTESYVECRRSMCIVLSFYPPRTDQQPMDLEPLLRAASREQGRLAQAVGLMAGPAFGSSARDGPLVLWHTFHRRCGPEWQCLQ
jgi:hypothetical protein